MSQTIKLARQTGMIPIIQDFTTLDHTSNLADVVRGGRLSLKQLREVNSLALARQQEWEEQRR